MINNNLPKSLNGESVVYVNGMQHEKIEDLHFLPPGSVIEIEIFVQMRHALQNQPSPYLNSSGPMIVEGASRNASMNGRQL